MDKFRLDEYENSIERGLEAGDYEVLEDQQKYRKFAKEAAANFLKKSERINIRISPRDMQYLKAIAVEEGMPYQTLISSVLHKFVKSKFTNNDRVDM
jgi:predicted DNA binding CopG/RHH family protein